MPGHKTLQVGVVPYFEEDGRLLTVLVTARGNPGVWIFPKGHIEEGETAQFSAHMEAYEEAGLIGRIEKRPLGNFLYEKGGKSFKVVFYPFKIKKILVAWPESATRRRLKVYFSEVHEYVADSQLIGLAAKMHDVLQKKKNR